MSLKQQLFATKSLKVLLDEMAGDHRLKRVLGPVTLTALGVGAVIGAGIFVATGAAAKDVAGPALMISYVVAGVTCIFAALCYAEFASMAPVAGKCLSAPLLTLLFHDDGRVIRLDHRLGSCPGICGRSGHGRERMVWLLSGRVAQARDRRPHDRLGGSAQVRRGATAPERPGQLSDQGGLASRSPMQKSP